MLSADEASYQCGDFVGRRVQREMPGVENVNFGVRHIPAIGFGLGGSERKVVLPPDHEQARLLLAHPRLPSRVGFHVGPIVVKKIALNVGLPRLVEKSELVGPQIGVIAIHVRVVPT